VSDAHVDAPRRDEHRQADVARPRTVAGDEETGDGDEHHSGALSPAQDAGRVALDEPEDEHGGADGTHDEREHRDGQDALGPGARLAGWRFGHRAISS
jgi:hypothetical protein